MKKKRKNYIDNESLRVAYREYLSRDDVKLFLKKKKEKAPDFRIEDAPPLPKVLTDAILLIARKYATKSNWYAIDYKEDMIGDAVVACLRYGHGFDFEKSNNPLAYLTQFCHNAFIQRISIEKKHRQKKWETAKAMSYGQLSSMSNSDYHDIPASLKLYVSGVYDAEQLEEETRNEHFRKSSTSKKEKTIKNDITETLDL